MKAKLQFKQHSGCLLSLAGSCHKYRVCRDKSMLVGTKMILVAAPASDSLQWGLPERQEVSRPNTRYAAITDTIDLGDETNDCT